MKPSRKLSLCCAGVILILALSVIFTGCTQPASGPVATVAPPSVPASPTSYVPPASTMVLPHGVTIAIPNDWVKQSTLATGVRDYGRDTTNVATFTSPSEIAGDSSSSNSLTIDMEKNVQSDFDTYFNQATIALGKTYGTQMESHSVTLKLGGYDAYELDFQTKDVKGSYYFVNTKGSIYIFAFIGPMKPIAVRALQGEIEDMTKSIQIQPA
jgi:hypothetical protein